MSVPSGNPGQAMILRRQAEAVIQGSRGLEPLTIEKMSTAETLSLVHELQVHQIELELQNQELLKARQELEVSQARYFNLYDLAPVGYCSLTPGGLILEANQTAAKLLGASKESLVNRPLHGFIFKDDQDTYYLNRKHLLKTGERQAWESRMLDAAGRPLWVQLITALEQDRDGAAVCRLVMVDITERKGVEEALGRASRLNEQVIKSVQEGVIVHDLELRYRTWNPFMERLTGVVAKEVLGKLPTEVFPFLAETGVLAGLQRSLAGAVEEPLDLKLDFHNSGESGWVTSGSAPLRDGDGEIIGVIATVLDITRRKGAEEARLNLLSDLQQSQKMESLGLLASGIAHDMNNVLGAILALSSVNLLAQPKDSPTFLAFETISEAAVRGGAMVKRLLSFARRHPSEKWDLDLNAILQGNAQMLESSTLSKINLVLDCVPDLHPIHGDGYALGNVVINLCVNAVDAMPETGTLTLRTRNVDPGWVEVSVEDTGSGMSKEVLAKAFDPFFTTKEAGKGTGLGLSLVFSTVKAHDGQVELQSEPGRGTAVRLRFPALATPSPAPEPLPEIPAAAASAPLKVLLVDDDELVLRSTQMLLEALGMPTVIAWTGEEALEKIQAGYLPDVVILDLNMPGLGGAGTLERLRELCPQVPVLLATGRADEVALEVVAAHPRATLLPKPYSVGDLREHLALLG